MKPGGRTPRVEIIDRPIRRLACLADVHANIAALEAIFDSELFASVDAVAFLGCLTTGPEPLEVLELSKSAGKPAYFLAGNGERAVVDLADGHQDDEWIAGEWILEHHGPAVETIRSWPGSLVADVEGLGQVRLCHGSPRSDNELLTPPTTPDHVEEATRGVAERTVVHGHTHLQYERRVRDLLIVGPGSVGLPYTADGLASYWAVLGPDVELARTPYELEYAKTRIAATGYPDARYVASLEHPRSPEEMMRQAQDTRFSD